MILIVTLSQWDTQQNSGQEFLYINAKEFIYIYTVLIVNYWKLYLLFVIVRDSVIVTDVIALTDYSRKIYTFSFTVILSFNDL